MENRRLTENQIRTLRYLRNALVHGGNSPSIRDIAEALGYRSPRSAFILLNELIEKGFLKRKEDGKLQLKKGLIEQEDHARTVNVPLVGTVPCGSPLLAEENIEAYVPVSTSLARPGSRYFLLKAKGDSMDQAGIENGNLLLVRQQQSAENGERFVALSDDEATVKEFHREENAVILKPKSKNKKHKPIILTENFIIQGVVTTVLPANL
jgi:repressor LexA